jgi:glycosyltransferase involved in cell wall biosynthesis
MVSVLLPFRNAAATLATALRSVVRQRCQDFECLLIDDGSSDDSGAIAAEQVARDRRLRLVSGPGVGLVAALNLGLESCRGHFIARMDADDLMHRERLSAQLAWFLGHPELVAVGSRVRLFPRVGMTEGLLAYERWLNGITAAEDVAREAFVECPVAHPTLMIRRREMLAERYCDRGWPEDYDLVLRLLAAGHRLGVVPRRLHAWRDSPGRLSRTCPRYGLGRFTACKAAFLSTGFLSGTARYGLWGFGDTGRQLRKALLAHGKAPAWIVELHKGRIGNRIHGAPVIAPSGLGGVERLPIVVSVAGIEARGLIREEMRKQGFEEGVDYVCAA